MKYLHIGVITSLLLLGAGMMSTVVDASQDSAFIKTEFENAVTLLKKGDRDAAVSGFSKLAELGHIEAQYELATIFFKERGGPDGKQKEAYYWYKIAAENGHAKAQHKLGLMYSVGIHVINNSRESIKWYHAAATQGLVEAQHDLGVFYVKYFSRNYINSYAWLLIASMNGYDAADRKLKVLAQKMAPHQISKANSIAEKFVSKGTWIGQPAALLDWEFRSGLAMFRQKKYNTAFSILYPHAQEGYPHAQFIIGYFYESGLGAPPDYVEAYQWFKKAAFRGDSEGQYFLGRSYYIGKGVPQNYAEAYKWLAISKENWKKNIQENINLVLEHLSPKEKLEIETEVTEWLATQPKYTSTKQPKGPRRPKF